ncbi:hypothetical protein [Mycobacterium marinum]|uniref:hypothetical protein n=1 Tax=Mycobacterium marinum TaxID=1781 RepID=UPI0023587195|nr:hypothetical protein [Mycobacterium marinum]MDC9006816.1 hypothetical protein [Mycobacterium marinum]
MTTAERFSTFAAANRGDVLIAGVPWPRHKLFAVIAGLVTFVLVGTITSSAAPSVLGATAVGVVVAVALKMIAKDID